MESRGSSFATFSVYLRALADTPHRMANRALAISSPSEEMNGVRSRSGASLQRRLRWFDLIGFGIGGMVGAGVFVTSGIASRQAAGPSVILSFLIAGLSSLLSAFCYTEFAVDMPVAGGAFTYIRVTFGEFAAFLAGANIITDYVLSNAAVSRSFTAYLATAFGGSSGDNWRITLSSLPKGFNQMDFGAVAIVLIITLLICYGTRESSLLNMLLTALHLAFIAFVIVMGFWKGHWKNLVEPGNPNHAAGFFPYGAAGVFNGAAMVYVSYIGYDAVSTMAEEVRDPVKDIPIGVSGSVTVVTILYCLMAASMSVLRPYDLIDPNAPFSGGFVGKGEGLGWAGRVIGVGASFGILTSLTVAMLGQARYMCVIGRSSVVPPWFAVVHPWSSTPVNASAFLGVITASIALFTDLSILLNLVSIGTLFVFYMVANAVIYRRYAMHETANQCLTKCFLFVFSLVSTFFTLTWRFFPNGNPKIIMLLICSIVAVISLHAFNYRVPQGRNPEAWGVPLMPWLPSLSVFVNIFLLGSLDGPSYIRFSFLSVVSLLVYVLYSVHASYDAEPMPKNDIEVLEESREIDGAQNLIY